MTRRPTALVAAMAFVLIAAAGEQVHARQSIDPYLQKHSVGQAFYAPQFQARKHRGPGRYKKTTKARKPKAVQRRAARLVHHVRPAVTHFNVTYSDVTPRIMPHPHGCPRRAFCGCGAALDVFGRHVRELWLARNWFKFPRAMPAPGMVAVRRHHVFVIREVRGPALVLAYDANSGGRKTRLHLRSLAGYVVVNPRGYRTASR